MRALAFVAAAVAALALVPAALADGDPASDYLITQPAFFPFEAKPDKAHADELVALPRGLEEDRLRDEGGRDRDEDRPRRRADPSSASRRRTPGSSGRSSSTTTRARCSW